MEMYFIRHGQSEWQTQRTKDQNSSLTVLGIEQCHLLNSYLRNSIIFSHENPIIFSSPLTRALQTATELKKPYVIDDRIQEASFHLSQSLPFYENISLYKGHTSDNEHYNIFKKTVKDFLIHLISMKKQKTALIYTHGGVIKTCLRIIHDNDGLCYTINNCSITRIAWFRGRWHIHLINDTSFLHQHMITK